MVVQKHCPKCADQTNSEKTPHSIRNGNWHCGLCGHETPKKTYNTKKKRDVDNLFKKLMGEDAPVNAVSGGNISGMGVDKPGKPGSGEPGVKPAAMSRYKRKNQSEAPSPIMSPVAKRKSFTQFIKGK